MAGASMTARLRMDGRGFQNGVTKAKAQVASLKSNIASNVGGMVKQFGALAAAAIAAMRIKAAVTWATRMRDLADSFGVTTKFVQQMDYAFKQTGGDVEVAFKSIRKMMLGAAIAVNTLTSKLTAEVKIDAFKQLGISLEDLNNKAMKPEEMFMKIAAHLKDADKNSKELHEALNVVFGKSGSQLLVTFNSDLAGMVQRLDELNAIVEEETIRRLGAMGDKLEEWKTQEIGVWAKLTATINKGWNLMKDQFLLTFEIMGQRLVSFGESIGLVASSFGKLWEYAKTGDTRMLDRATDDLRTATSMMGYAVGGETGKEGAEAAGRGIEAGKGFKHGVIEGAKGLGSVLKGFFETPLIAVSGGEIADIKRGRKAQEDKDAQARKDAADLKKEIAAIGAVHNERMKQLEKINELEEKAKRRKFAQLSPEKQLLELTKERKEAEEALAKIAKPIGDVSKDPRLKGLKPQDRENMLLAIEAEKLEYKEQEEKVAGLTDKEKLAKDKLKTVAKPGKEAEMSGTIAQTYTSLSRIGGQLGAKSPQIELSKLQIKLAKSSDEYLANISQVTTETFKG